jgi:uncharacterized membrane protein YiaA
MPINEKLAVNTIIVLSVAVVLLGVWNARDYTIITLEIPLSGLSQEVTIFYISDIHLGPFRG